jgi:hypothetical protein
MTQIYSAFIPPHRQLKAISIISKRKNFFKTLSGIGFDGKPGMKPNPGIGLLFFSKSWYGKEE